MNKENIKNKYINLLIEKYNKLFGNFFFNTVLFKFADEYFSIFQVCENGHIVNTWCSQPVMNMRLRTCDFLSAANILISGNNYRKIALWAQMMNLKFLSAFTFHKIQSTYLVPTVDSYWAEHQQEVIESFRGHPLVVACMFLLRTIIQLINIHYITQTKISH